MVIELFQWLLMVINDYGWLSNDIDGCYQWLCMVIEWLLMVIDGY